MGGPKRKNSNSGGGAGGAEQPETAEQKSKLCLIDLAGSERADRSGASGARLREAGAINKSLSTLSEVIKALSQSNPNDDSKTDFIPYRNSVLTWLLKDCLGGNSKTVILAAISPAHTSYAETLSTLRYVERAKLISVNAVVNDGNSSPVVLALREEVDELLEQMEADQLAMKYEVQTRLKLQQEHDVERQELQQQYDKLASSQSGIRQLEEALSATKAELMALKQQVREKDEQLQKMALQQGEQMQQMKEQQEQVAAQAQTEVDSGKLEKALAAQQAEHDTVIAEVVKKITAEHEAALKKVEEEHTKVAAKAVEDAVIESRIADSKQARADAGRSKMRAVQSALKAKEVEHAETIQTMEAKLRTEYELKVEAKVGETALATAQAHAQVSAHVTAQATAEAEAKGKAAATAEAEAKARAQELEASVEDQGLADRERADKATAEADALRNEVERLKKQLGHQQQQTAAALAGGDISLEDDMMLPDCLMMPILQKIEAKHRGALREAVNQRQSEHEEALSALAEVRVHASCVAGSQSI
jgi:hypothetical protein